MALNEKFLIAVENKDTSKLKTMLVDTLMIDTDTDKFKEMMQVVEAHEIDIFDEYDGGLFKESRDWTQDYLNEELTNVLFNFSRERLALLVKMTDYFSKQSVPKATGETQPAQVVEKKSEKKPIVSQVNHVPRIPRSIHNNAGMSDSTKKLIVAVVIVIVLIAILYGLFS